MCVGDNLQHDEHTGVDTQGHEDQPHQPSPHWDSCGGHDGHGGVHPLCHPHVPYAG